ncbi:MAG: hypothetical protein OXF84_10010 [Bacteroidetes bacterium]|nr:hypothetical protein [Bacteroidota bacterium]
MELQIVKIENYGKKITLSDRSVWEVFYPDLPKLLEWSPTHKVIVRDREDMESWTIRTRTIFPYTTIMEHVGSGRMIGVKPYTRS